MKLCYNDNVRLTVGSLFSGCGGLDLGIERAGFETIWFCENDKWCRKILEKRWPGIPIYDDARNFQPEDVDILIGGFPCQPVSFAGRRNGTDDPKWLWTAYERAIRILRPQYIIVENVPGLFRHGFEDVLSDLAVQGYNAGWFSLQSSDIGAPHRRKRVFILATDSSRLGFGQDSGGSSEEQGEARGREKNDYFPQRLGEKSISPAALADTVSGRFKKRQSKWELQLIESEHQAPSDPDSQYEYRAGRIPGTRGQEFTDSDFGNYAEAIRRWSELNGLPPAPRDDFGRLSPYFVEWMMGFPEGWTEGVSKTQRLKMLGNSVQVQCAQVVGNLLREKVKNE